MVAPLDDGAQTRALADVLDGRRVASVFCDDETVRDAEVLASRLGAALRASAALRRAQPGESPAQVVQRHADLLEEIADLHRGETVLVLGDAAALDLVVPALVDGAPAPDGVVELENDADGWVLRTQHG